MLKEKRQDFKYIQPNQIKVIKQCYEHLQSCIERQPLIEELESELENKFNFYFPSRLSDYEKRQWVDFSVNYEEEIEETETELKFRLSVKNNLMETTRINLGLTQEKLGAITKLGVGTICQIETCRVIPNRKQQENIANALNLKVELLFPEWMETFTENWKSLKKEKIIPYSQNKISYKEMLQIDSGDYQNNQQQLNNSFDRKFLLSIISELSQKEQILIKMRNGFDNQEPKTFEEVAKYFGVTRERIRQIESKIHEKIRNHPSIDQYRKQLQNY